MEVIKDFFTGENMAALWEQFYSWLEGILLNIFGNFSYGPLRVLLINPWFWLIIILLIVLGILFRKR